MSALGQKQTCAPHTPMSAKCQKRTSQRDLYDLLLCPDAPGWHMRRRNVSTKGHTPFCHLQYQVAQVVVMVVVLL